MVSGWDAIGYAIAILIVALALVIMYQGFKKRS